VKFLLFIALVAVCAGLFFDDKQNKADLATERTTNANLTAQLNSYQAAVYQLKDQLSNAQAVANRAQAQIQVQQQPQYQSPLQTDHLQLSH